MKAKGCKSNEVYHKGECKEKMETVKDIVRDADFEVNPQAMAYFNSLDESKRLYGEKGITTQIKYLEGNLHAENPEQRLAKKQLKDIADNEDPREELEEDEELKLDEIEFGEISRGFESFTEHKTKGMSYGEPTSVEDIHSMESGNSKITLGDFKEYSDRTDYPLKKVLAANPWQKQVLTEDAQEKVKEAKEDVEITF